MLKAGMWIAQGPETNVLLLLSGVEPLLEVVGAIDLNYWFSARGTKLSCCYGRRLCVL